MRVRLTAGDSARIAHMSRALGRLASVRESNVVVIAVDCVSTTGDAPVTVTFSLSDATPSSVLTVAVNPSVTRIPSRTTVENPASSNFTLYSPGGTAANRNVPSSLVTAVRAPIIDGLAIVTVTPGRMADVLSVTR